MMSFPFLVRSCLSLFILSSVVSGQKDNADRCECFRTNGSTHYFANHVFRDFRNIGGNSGDVSAIITDAGKSAGAFATSKYFLSDEWQDIWTTQSWNNSEKMEENSASVLMVNSPNNVYIEESSEKDPSYRTFLTLRTSRLPDFQSAAEIASTDANYQYLSMRFLARVIGSPGACAGIFTYLEGDSDSAVQEADIEILTNGPRNMVQYTNQPSDSDSGHPLPKATRNSTNPGNRDWTLWNTYRYDWTPDTSAWYVNGESVANISFQVPRDPTQVIINMWSDGGMWTGNMSTYEQAYLQIQWMQMVYNTSGPARSTGQTKRDGLGERGPLPVRDSGIETRREKGCALVCSVDESIQALGTPAFLYNDTGSSAVGAWRAAGTTSLSWMPALIFGVVFSFGL